MIRSVLHFNLTFVTVFTLILTACGPATPVADPAQESTTAWDDSPPPTPTQPPRADTLAGEALAAPAVTRRQPVSATLHERHPAITIAFTRAMDPATTAAALSVEPTLPLAFTWEKGNVLSLVPTLPLLPGTQYTFTLSRDATDVYGNALAKDYEWEYQMAGVIARYIQPNRLSDPLVTYFTYPMDTASVERALSIEPSIPGRLSWDKAAKVATFTPDSPFSSTLTYTVGFANQLLDANGDVLPVPGPFSFTTPPPILAASPVKGTGVNPATTIRITFDRPMDHAATEAAFAISPEVQGHFEWSETTLTFRPDLGYLDESTAYNILINTSARAADGTAVFNLPYHMSFRTGWLEDIASFGEGPNAQVVDVDGRRAIQFVLVQKDTPLVTFELYRLNLEQFLDRYSSGFRGVLGYEKKSISTEGTSLAARWQVSDTSQAIETDNWGYAMETRLPADVPPGAYILNLSAGQVNDQLIVLLTRRVVMVKQAEGQLVAWVTDINGQAAGEVEVGVYARNGELIALGRTDGDGLYRTTVDRDPQPLIVVAHDGDDLTATGLSGEWQTHQGYGWAWWQPAPVAQKYAAYIYTDRPIYRPGQTVYFKVIARRDDDAILSVPPEDTPVTVRIRDARNNVVQTLRIATNQFGTAHGEFNLAAGAMLGSYAVEVTLSGEAHRQAFKVQDYRKPDYAVTVSTDARRYVEGDTIRVAVDSRYFFGEPVPDAQVTIRTYQLGWNYYCWETCDSGEYVWYDSYEPQIRGTSDADGRFTFTLSAQVGSFARDKYWWSDLQQGTWGIEATVDDGSHQAVSGFVVVEVFNHAEQMWLDTGGYLKTPGQTFDVAAGASTIFDEPVSGRTLTLRLRRWSPAAGDYTTVVQSLGLTTDAGGQASAPLTVTEPGYYQVHLTGRDRRGNALTYDSWLYVFSEAQFWEPRANNDLSVAADKDTYAPGDVARLVIESSFSGPALLTFERGTTRREQLVNLSAPLTRVDVPILPDDTPNVAVTISAWKEQATTLAPRSPSDYSVYSSLADSQLRTATLDLHVPATDKALTVTITPDREIYAPREQATFTLRVTNARGEPVSAEVSLALVDEAIFSLSDELSGPIFDAFYFERANLVQTFNSMAPRRTLWMGCECGGGGGGGGDVAANPRSQFPDTAAWVPVLHTDWKGEATVTLSLPDSLTSWRLTARAATADTQVGEAFTNILTQQPVVVRPLLPRTLTAGDRVELSAIVHNYSGQRRDIAVTIESIGLQIVSLVTQTVSVAAGEQRIVGWSAIATEAGEAQVTVRASADEIGDAVRLTLPVQPLAVRDVTTQVGDFTSEFNTTVVMPGEALGMSTVRIELSRSIAGSLMSGLAYLTGFPYGCVEQTMSKALPNAAVGRALYQLGIGDPTLQADLPPKINASVQRLYGFQHNDGGWGWWYDDRSDAYQTAWVVFGLSVTAEAGYEVDSAVIRRGVDWLSANLPSMDVRTRAFALYSMSVAGYGDLAATRGLALQSSKLDTFSQAAVALALHKLGATADAHTMLEVLAQAAVVKDGRVYWPNAAEDGYYHAKTMSSTLRSTALALQAFVRINPNHALEPGIVRYLMSQRRQDGWGTTNETSFTILALTDHLLVKEASTVDTTYSVELNGQIIADGTLGQGEPAVSLEISAGQMQAGENQLRMRQSGGGSLYYVVSNRVFLPQAEIAAAGNVMISRAYLDAETRRPITGTVTPGRLVMVQLTVTLPDNSFYFLVEDRLPGGLEALNEGLNITSHEGSAYDWYEPQHYWERYGYNNKEVFGDRVSFFITEVGKGRHTYTYVARATRSGEFVAMPAEAWAMYDLAVWGRSASSAVVVK